jgi:GNAT superfamily N-acetyltransferase
MKDPAAQRHDWLLGLDAKMRDGLRRFAPQTLEVGGGIAGLGREGWWGNECTGLGVNGPILAQDLREITDFYREADRTPKVILFDHFAGEANLTVLGDAGYRLCEVESAVAIRLPADLPAPDVRVHPVAGDLAELITLVERGFKNDETFELPAAELAEWREMRTADGIACFAAHEDEELAGGGSVDCSPSPGFTRVGLVFAGSVLPRFRRRGLHRELLLARIHHAATAGCEAAVTIGSPAGQTVRTARRLGMETLATILTFECNP